MGLYRVAHMSVDILNSLVSRLKSHQAFALIRTQNNRRRIAAGNDIDFLVARDNGGKGVFS